MKKVLCILVSMLSFSNSFAQKNSEIFITATIEKFNNDTTRKNGLSIMRAYGFLSGAPADSIVKSGSTVFLFYGNYKIGLTNKEDYLFYLDLAIKYREAELRSIRLSTRDQRYYPVQPPISNSYGSGWNY